LDWSRLRLECAAQRRWCDTGTGDPPAVSPAHGVGTGTGRARRAISVSLALWMLPVVLGLALAIPLALLTGRRSQSALLRTPEDIAPPPVVQRAMMLRREWEADTAPTVAHLLGDGALLNAHIAMLPAPRRPRLDPINPILLQARA